MNMEHINIGRVFFLNVWMHVIVSTRADPASIMKETRMEVISNHRYESNNTIATIVVRSVLDCSTKCAQLTRCLSANVGPKQLGGERECRLHYENSTSLEPDNSWKFIFKKRENTPQNCKQLYSWGYRDDGVYSVDPDGQGAFDVYCELNPQRSDGTTEAGWTVIQRRVDDSVSFNRGWVDYEAGFGDLYGNHWLGLDKIHRLTSMSPLRLHIYLDTFDDQCAHASYSQFEISDSSDFYRLSVSGYSGTADDGLTGAATSNNIHDNMQFSTHDNDRDEWSNSCGDYYSSGWWFNACFHGNLNGLYVNGGTFEADKPLGIMWNPYRGDRYSMKTSVMKIRRD